MLVDPRIKPHQEKSSYRDQRHQGGEHKTDGAQQQLVLGLKNWEREKRKISYNMSAGNRYQVRNKQLNQIKEYTLMRPEFDSAGMHNFSRVRDEPKYAIRAQHHVDERNENQSNYVLLLSPVPHEWQQLHKI
jgi:hypothetical protein